MRTKREIQNSFRRLVKLLNTRGYYILEKKLRNYHGYLLVDKGIVIYSKKTPANKLRYLIHEGLHDVFPTWSERDIRSATSEVFNGLTIKQMIKLGEIYLRLRRRGKRRFG